MATLDPVMLKGALVGCSLPGHRPNRMRFCKLAVVEFARGFEHTASFRTKSIATCLERILCLFSTLET